MSPGCMSDAADHGGGCEESAPGPRLTFCDGPCRAIRSFTLTAFGVSDRSVRLDAPALSRISCILLRLAVPLGVRGGTLPPVGGRSATGDGGLPGGCPLSVRK